MQCEAWVRRLAEKRKLYRSTATESMGPRNKAMRQMHVFELFMKYLSIAQLTLSIVLIILILLQERSSGLSGMFGGGSEGGAYQTRRGFERIIFVATVVIAIAFAALSLVNLIKQ
jgi:protein translocase SecG subunit